MKKYFSLTLILIIIAYSLPVITSAEFFSKNDVLPVQTAAPTKSDQNQNLLTDASSIDSSITITLLHNGQVLNLSLDNYIAGVLCAEMPASFPYEALKAQAVAARTHTMYKIRSCEINPSRADSHNGAQLCSDYKHCKAYRDIDNSAADLWGKNAAKYTKIIKSAVADTDGQILEYDGQPIAAVFHAVSAGKTENAKDIWGSTVPYLVSVDTPGADDDSKCYAEMKVPLDRFREIFLAAFPDADLSGNPNSWFKNSTRSDGGSIISVYVGGIAVSGAKIRELFALNSANFTVSSDQSDFIFNTSGRGHGVGMSQYGARRMALDGADYTEILKSYYTGVSISLLPTQ